MTLRVVIISAQHETWNRKIEACVLAERQAARWLLSADGYLHNSCDFNPVKVKAEEQLVVGFKNLAAV
jgi:hypothetical protein